MARNDFFLDTGIIFGQFDPRDPYYDGSINHLENYTYIDHNYYAVKRIALKEVDNISRRKARDHSKSRNFRKAVGLKAAQMKVNVESLFLHKVKNIDYGIPPHSSFNPLYKNLLGFLERNKKNNDPKDRDANILTNLFIWDKEIQELHNPQLVTIDKGDLVDNESKLKDEAKNCLHYTSRLTFLLIPMKHAS